MINPLLKGRKLSAKKRVLLDFSASEMWKMKNYASWLSHLWALVLSPLSVIVLNCCFVILPPQMGLGGCVFGKACFSQGEKFFPYMSDLHMRKHKYYKFYKKQGRCTFLAFFLFLFFFFFFLFYYFHWITFLWFLWRKMVARWRCLQFADIPFSTVDGCNFLGV